MKILRLLTLFFTFLSVNNAIAIELTQKQNAFRTSLKTFLTEEGFSPNIDDEDNSLIFKKEGVSFWITVADESPFYIEFHRSGFNTEEANTEALLIA